MIVSRAPQIQMMNGDCMEAMAGMEDNAYDLAIVDPPYGIDVANMNLGDGVGTESRRWVNKDWDTKKPNEDYFKELKRVSRNQIIWGANYFEGMPPTKCWLIWDKMQEFSGATFEMAWTSFDTPAKAFRMARCEAYVGKDKINPAQKPVALYKWLLTNYTNEGDRILDTHGGSGSIAIACYDMGYDLDWYELDKDYYADAVERFKEHKKQGQLFRPVKEQQKAKQGELI